MKSNNSTIHKSQDCRSFLLAGLAFTILLITWELMARFSGWSVHVFPGPLTVFRGMGELIVDGTLLNHTVASLFRITVGFYLAILLGLPLGIILGRNKKINDLLNPIIQFLRPISPIAWIPLAMLWFGIGDQPAIFLIFLSSFFPLVVATTITVSSINPVFFQVATNFNFNRAEIITKIIIPAITPATITTLRISLSVAWLVVVAAEMIAVRSGLGYLILDSRNGLRMDYVMVGMIVIGIVGLLLDLIVRRMGQIESTGWYQLENNLDNR